MKQNFFKIVLIVTLVVSIFYTAEADASSSFPEFSLSSQKEVTKTSEIATPVEINIKKQLTRDVLFLQEQINLLEAMVARQGEIQKIATSYREINVPFTQPAPPQSACEKLPSNILCLYSYPDIDMNKAFLDDVLDNYADFVMPDNIDLGLSDINIEPTSVSSQEEIVSENEYYWTDIQCLQANCSAVLVKETDTSDRLRVRVGDSLVDNLIVTSITSSGLSITDEEKNTIKVKPLNSSRQLNLDTPDESGISQILDNTAAELETNDVVPEISITPPQMSTNQPSEDTNNSQSEVLTSTGLF